MASEKSSGLPPENKLQDVARSSSSDPIGLLSELPSKAQLQKVARSARIGKVVDVDPLPPRSRQWARETKPFTWFLLALLATVIVLPFFLPLFIGRNQLTTAFDWAKTVLAPITGFAGAVIGYYYGTREQQGA